MVSTEHTTIFSETNNNVDPKIILFAKIFAGMKDVCNSQQLQIAYT